MRHQESIVQRQCVKWFRLQYPNLVLFAIPNGGRRKKNEASIMVGEGVLAGCADLFLAHPSMSEYGTVIHGLFIEMKTVSGKQTQHQKDFERKVFVQGYDYEVCRSLDEFMNVVKKYLK